MDEKQSEWINVEERLPPTEWQSTRRYWRKSNRVLVLLSDAFVEIAVLHVDADGVVTWESDTGYETHCDVTHWMPLPGPQTRLPAQGRADNGGVMPRNDVTIREVYMLESLDQCEQRYAALREALDALVDAAAPYIEISLPKDERLARAVYEAEMLMSGEREDG